MKSPPFKSLVVNRPCPKSEMKNASVFHAWYILNSSETRVCNN
jgi:hypothetical protein